MFWDLESGENEGPAVDMPEVIWGLLCTVEPCNCWSSWVFLLIWNLEAVILLEPWSLCPRKGTPCVALSSVLWFHGGFPLPYRCHHMEQGYCTDSSCLSFGWRRIFTMFSGCWWPKPSLVLLTLSELSLIITKGCDPGPRQHTQVFS